LADGEPPGFSLLVLVTELNLGLIHTADRQKDPWVSAARVRTSPGKPARIDLRVELQSATQLTDTLNQIRAMADVLDIALTGIG
jgi:hypothetical protein